MPAEMSDAGARENADDLWIGAGSPTAGAERRLSRADDYVRLEIETDRQPARTDHREEHVARRDPRLDRVPELHADVDRVDIHEDVVLAELLWPGRHTGDRPDRSCPRARS
jgi:hypothetical protein